MVGVKEHDLAGVARRRLVFPSLVVLTAPSERGDHVRRALEQRPVVGVRPLRRHEHRVLQWLVGSLIIVHDVDHVVLPARVLGAAVVLVPDLVEHVGELVDRVDHDFDEPLLKLEDCGAGERVHGIVAGLVVGRPVDAVDVVLEVEGMRPPGVVTSDPGLGLRSRAPPLKQHHRHVDAGVHRGGDAVAQALEPRPANAREVEPRATVLRGAGARPFPGNRIEVVIALPPGRPARVLPGPQPHERVAVLDDRREESLPIERCGRPLGPSVLEDRPRVRARQVDRGAVGTRQVPGIGGADGQGPNRRRSGRAGRAYGHRSDGHRSRGAPVRARGRRDVVRHHRGPEPLRAVRMHVRMLLQPYVRLHRIATPARGSRRRSPARGLTVCQPGARAHRAHWHRQRHTVRVRPRHFDLDRQSVGPDPRVIAVERLEPDIPRHRLDE